MGFFDIFGGDYGASGYRGQQQSYLSGLGTLGGQYGGLASAAAGQYGSYAPQEAQAGNDLAKFYATDLGTSQAGAAFKQQAAGSTTAAYLNARAHLAADSQASGFSGGPSSTYGGGLASIENGYAGSIGSAANQWANARFNNLGSRLTGLYNLRSGQANEAYGRETGAMGAQEGIYSNLAGQYGNLATAAQARTDARNSALINGLGQAATLWATRGASAGNYGGADLAQGDVLTSQNGIGYQSPSLVPYNAQLQGYGGIGGYNAPSADDYTLSW